MNVKKSLSIGLGILLSAGLTTAVIRNRSVLGEKLHDVVSREPSSPQQLSATDWKEALKETKSALSDKNIPMLAAGVAFFSTIAFFPTLAAFVSIFSLVANPHQIDAAIHAFETYLPGDLAGLINSQLQATAGKQTANLIAAIVATAIALWSASSSAQNLIKATNEAYEVEETRGFVKLKLISIGLVLLGIVVGLPLMLLTTAQGGWLTDIGTPHWLVGVLLIGRWVVIAVLMSLALAAFYRYGPDRRNPHWQWVSWGAAAATLIWLLGTLLFFFYAQNFGNFSKNYGLFAGIIVLMTWLNLSAFIFLLGAQVNHRLESKTAAITAT